MLFWRAIRDTLEAKGYRIDRTPIYGGVRYAGTETVLGKTFDVFLVVFDEGFVERPRFYLRNVSEAAGILPHLDANNNFCYSAPETLILDSSRPGEAVLLCREIFLAELERSVSGRHVEEVLEEFPRYWQGHNVASDIDVGFGGSAKLYRWSTDEYGVMVLTNSNALVEFYRTRHPSDQGFNEHNFPAQILTYTDPSPFLSFRYDFQRLSSYLDWLKGFGDDFDDKVLEKMTSEVGVPSAVFLNGPIGMYGIWPKSLPFKPKKGGEFRKPFAQKMVYHRFSSKIEVLRYRVRNIGDDYVYGRSLVKRATLENKRICILGCGTIGSHLAKFVAQSGAGSGGSAELKLIDNQIHEPGNIGRHLLGHTALGHNKATAVARYLKETYPCKNIHSVDGNAIDQLASLAGYDLIIDATGDSTFSNGLNQFSKNQAQYPPILFVWLEGLGAAAQAFMIRDEDSACYRCLAPVVGERPRYHPLKNYGENVFEAASCSDGPYIPYSVAASATAAGLALEMMLDWAGGAPGKSLRTRLVDANPEVTRFVKDTTPTRHKNCPICYPTS